MTAARTAYRVTLNGSRHFHVGATCVGHAIKTALILARWRGVVVSSIDFAGAV